MEEEKTEADSEQRDRVSHSWELVGKALQMGNSMSSTG